MVDGSDGVVKWAVSSLGEMSNLRETQISAM